MRWATLAVCFVLGVAGQDRKVAITIDDLPIGGDLAAGCAKNRVTRITAKLLTPFWEGKIPVIGFVNEGRCEYSERDLRDVLTIWLGAGAELGNHTFSHLDLNTSTVEEFKAAVIQGETVTKQLLKEKGREERYLRHPFLHVGRELPKRRAVESFLKERGYQIAPITLDNSDYMFAAVYARALAAGDSALANRVRDAYLPYLESTIEFFEKRSVEVTGHEVAQTLLIHVSQLNADTMPEMLTMFRERGYSFVSLEEALKDPAYSLPDDYVGTAGFSWIHHWSQTKKMPAKMEPSEPKWILEEWNKSRRR